MLPDPRIQRGLRMLARWIVLRDQLRQRRLDLGLSQAQVAKRMDRRQDYVGALETRTKRIPNLATIWLWTDALELDVRTTPKEDA